MYLFLFLHFCNRKGGCFLKKLLVYIKDFRLECVLAPLFKLLEASFELIVPLVMAAIIDTRHSPRATRGYHRAHVPVCWSRWAAVGSAVLGHGAVFRRARRPSALPRRLRHALFAHIQTLSLSRSWTRVGTSTLITRMTSDINQVQTGVNMALRLLLRSPFVVFGAMIMAFTIDARCGARFSRRVIPLCCASVVFGIMLITHSDVPPRAEPAGQCDWPRRAKT